MADTPQKRPAVGIIEALRAAAGPVPVLEEALKALGDARQALGEQAVPERAHLWLDRAFRVFVEEERAWG